MSSIDLRSKCRNLRDLIVNKTNCSWTLIGKAIGKGKKASTYRVCCGKDCFTFAVKIQENTARRTGFYDTIKSEVVTQEKFAKLGLAPNVYDAFICNNEESFIVMDRLDMNIEDYATYLVKETNMSFEEIDKTLDAICDAAVKLMRIAHKNSLIHTDLNPGNIMVKLSDDAIRIPLSTKIVDFGNGPKEVSSEKEADALEDLHGIVLTFDMIKRNIKNIPRASQKEKEDDDEKMMGEDDIREILSTPIRPKRPSLDAIMSGSPVRAKRLNFGFDDEDEELS